MVMVTATTRMTGGITRGIFGAVTTVTVPNIEVTAIATILTTTAATVVLCLEPTGRMDSPFITWTDSLTMS